MRKSSFVVFILLFCFAFSLHAQKNDLNQPIPVDPQVKIGKLPNGLTYYIRRNQRPEKKAELRLVINAGSILEREDQRGLAHFVEHMAFNGTKNFEKNELISYLQSIGIQFGADLNAYTGFDETVYILPIPSEKKEMIDKGLLVLSDWASGITFDQAEIDKERGIVLEELRARSGAGQRMQDRYFPKLFAGSRYADRMPIGTKDVLQNFKRQAILDFYETWYRPDLMAVVVVGDIDPNEIEAKIKQQFSPIKPKREPTERPAFPVADTKGTLVAVETDKESPGTSVQLIYKKPAAAAAKTLANLRQQLIRRFYNALLNTRLNEVRQSPNAPFTNASAAHTTFFRSKDAFVMNAGTNPQGIGASIETLLNENRRAQLFGFTQAELDRLKQSYLAGLENNYKEKDKIYSSSYAGDYVANFLTGDPVTSPEFDYQFGKRIVPTIALADLNAAAKQTTSDDNRAVIIIGQATADAKYPTEAEVLRLLKESQTAKLAPYTETITNEPLIKDLPATARVTEERRDEKFGITHWTLSNGVRVVLKPTDYQSDEIQMSGFSPGGMSLIDTERAISGLYLNQVVGESGVKNFSRIELGKMLAGKQARAAIGVDELFETVNGYATPKDLETMLQLAYLKFTNVNFDRAVFDSVISKQRISLPAILATPQAYFGEQVFKIVSNNHPRAFNPFDITYLDRAKFDHIQQIYKDRFADASDFTFIFVGNFEPEQIKSLVVKYLGNLPTANRKETWKDWEMRPPAGPLEKTFKKGSDDRAVVQIHYVGAAEYSRDEARNLSALGELLTIKLIEVLREEKSGVYGASASGRLIKQPSGRYAFTVGFVCAPGNVESLVAAVNAEIVKIQNGEIDEKEIAKVKQARFLQADESVKTNSYWMAVISNQLRQGDDILTLEESKARINLIDKNALQKAAQKYLKTERRLQFVLLPETAAASKAAGQIVKQN